ncbi:MAG: AAA family ATPase [Solirubrobacteraceae bacterium]|nr:AAA family ATPase [Solirubrobacteraceae bacterium]
MTKNSPVVRPSRSSGELLERGEALLAIDALLAAGRDARGRLLLVEGHAGIGKTALLEEAVVRARADDMTVMRARASELESDFQFGLALQLFEPLLSGADDDVRDRLLAGSAALAGPLLERPTSWAGDEAESRSYPVMHGLFWVLSNLAETGPVLIAIDDVHWADRASLRLVLYLLQRLDEMAVSIVAARRLGEPGAPDDLLAQISTHVTSRALRPAPLSREGARRMVADALPGADEAFGDACWRMTEGNVFLLEELIAAARDEGWQPTAQNAPRIGTLAPEAVLRAVAVRLMRLSDDAAGVARAVAVLGDDAQLRHVAALSGRAADRIVAAADALAASEILRPVDAGALRFAHPLLASAVYADIATAERAALHRRAAEILHGEGIAPERVAAHLLPSPGSGDAWVVDLLCDVARHAVAAGAPESAASYLSRALQEPPAAGQRAAVLHELGASEAATGLASAVEHLEEALAAEGSATGPGGGGAARARTLLALGRALAAAGRHAEALVRFDEAVACADASSGSPADAALAALARAEAGTLGVLDPMRRRALLDAAAAAADDAPRAEHRALTAMRCLHRAMAGAPRAEILELARAAADAADGSAEQRARASVPIATSVALQACDELLWSEREMTAAMDRARAAGSTIAFATATLARAGARWAQGRLVEALDDAEHALGAQRHGWRHLLPWAYGAVVGVHVDRGELGAADAAAGGLDPGVLSGLEGSAVLAPWHEALGRLALAQRRDGDALAHFEAWRDVVSGVANPACGAAWRSASVPALVGLDRTDEARELAREELALARAFGAPRAISVALRALAHADGHGEIDAQIALLEEAVALVSASEARLELCRAQLELGTVLRRARRLTDAGRVLGDALELARACGAHPLEERVLEELEVAGSRMRRAARRGADALSPSERRVVALAIEGLSNRQIAEALFVTRKAVEWHLGNAYRKLDVRSRHELPAALGE